MAKNSELGYTGLVEFQGRITADFLREWRGLEAYKNANEMRLNSPIIGALLSAFEQPIRKMQWTFSSTQGDTDPRIELLNASRAAMSMSWNDHMVECLTMLPFGFSIFEKVYQRVDGRLLWRKFAPRGQDTVQRWLFDEDGSGGVKGFEQVSAPSYKLITLPIEKLIIYRLRVERGNPEGRSLLRQAWIPYYFAKHIQQIEAIGLERGLDGFPVITLPEGASTNADDTNSDAAKAAQMVRNIRNDEQAGVVLPTGWLLEMFAPGSQSRLDADKVIRRHESRILMSVLAQFMQLGQDGVGSQALSKDQSDFFTMSVNAVADIIADTFTKYAIPDLLKLNGYDAEDITLIHTPAAETDVTQLTTSLQQVANYVTWMPEDEAWLRSVLGMPEVDPAKLAAAQAEKQAQREKIAQSIKAGVGKEDTNTQAENNAVRFLELISKVKDAIGNDATVDILKSMELDKKNKRTDYRAAPDDFKRRKQEREMKEALTAHFEKQKKKVIKAAKELRG